MNNTIHEPEFIANTKNAVVFLIVLCFITCGTVFVLGGMVSPLFWKWLKHRCIAMSKEDAAKGKGTFESNLTENLRMAKVTLVVWFLLAWGFLVVAFWYGI